MSEKAELQRNGGYHSNNNGSGLNLPLTGVKPAIVPQAPLLPAEWRKTLLSFVLLQVALFVMCLAATYTHVYAPDRNRFPPLPDLVGDHLPFIEWGMQGSEMCMMIMVFLFVVLCVVFHKHRSIIIRRICTIYGLLVCLRTLTVISTLLPVLPPPSLCSEQKLDTIGQKLAFSFSTYSNLGFRIKGTRLCGDYMFSGHITFLTLFNMCLIEYSPWRSLYFRVLTSATNVLGVYLIIVGKGHYTVDVIVAVIIVYFVFQYYHSLLTIKASENTLTREHGLDHCRGISEFSYEPSSGSSAIRWFPLFKYFERNVRIIVPNEFEVPSPIARLFSRSP